MLVRLDHKIYFSHKVLNVFIVVSGPSNIRIKAQTSLTRDFARRRVLGDLSEGVPPVPIPNTEVKPYSPDGTARASVWESRKLPGLKSVHS